MFLIRYNYYIKLDTIGDAGSTPAISTEFQASVYVKNMSEEIKENPVPTGEKQVLRNEKGQFVEGVSGNPNGRPQGSLSLKTKIIHALEKYSEEKGKTLAEVFADIGIKKAIDGDHQFWKTIISYVDGMPKESIEHSGKIENILSEEQINELLNRRAKANDSGGEI